MSAVTPPSLLQVALVWRGKILAYRLAGPRDAVSIGPSPRAALTTPPLAGAGRFVLLAPARTRGRFRLRVGPGLSGEITEGGVARSAADVLASGAPSPSRKPADAEVREIELGTGDRARLVVDGSDGLRIEARFV